MGHETRENKSYVIQLPFLPGLTPVAPAAVVLKLWYVQASPGELVKNAAQVILIWRLCLRPLGNTVLGFDG